MLPLSFNEKTRPRWLHSPKYLPCKSNRCTLPFSRSATYTIPADLVRGKQKVTVRFQADEGSRVRPVFGLRMVRADQLK